jgi:hypothetical protein
MRMLSSGAVALSGLVAALTLHACGWFDTADDCALNPILGCGPWAPHADAGDDGGPDCSGDPTADPAIVTDACGVFVSASAAPGGDGTQATPFQTFAEAAAAKPARVFACAGMYTETMQVSFNGGVEVYGGFSDCGATSWTWSASVQAQIVTVAGVPGVVLGGGANKLENVSVMAPSVPMTMAGGSSIAMLVNGGSLDMTNGALTAGDAQDGAAGPTVADDPNLDGSTGASGANACDSGGMHLGAVGATNTCTATGGGSTAGSGGDGGDSMGDPAGSGTNGNAVPPAMAVGNTDGKGGLGEGQPTATLCSAGDTGAPGSAGSSGDGAAGIGVLMKTGYQGVAGAGGTNGSPGQGGGGGGGAKGIASATCMGSPANDIAGASGGAGGTGGCGGTAGSGGQPGGSSIALLVLDANVTLPGVTLTAGKGGNGGDGGNGQNGGKLGSGGMPGNGVGSANASCRGGDGGQGGGGGPGGGGQGGHSLGIAFQGKGMAAPKGGTFMINNNGSGGPGGNNNTTANMGKGADGVTANCWDFAANAACM